MRNISKLATIALIMGNNFRQNNTFVKDGELYLHGNLIATYKKERLFITNAGYQTNVTKDRLNALPNVNIKQVKGEWYLNGNIWDGELTEIV